MRKDQPSRTAFRVAVLRAAHQLLDIPKVFDDLLAVAITGVGETALLASMPEESRDAASRYMRAFVAARNRYAEDQLAQAVQRGTRQFVILGAGLDTFAYRNPHPDLNVFEVDHPATQTWKLHLVEASGIAIPDSVAFVPVDFAAQSLLEQLRLTGFKADAAAFFSWLGVTQYLTNETVLSTLKLISSLCPANGVVFDFAIPPSSLDARKQAAFEVLERRVRAAGEPFEAFFQPRDLALELKGMGFHHIEDLDGSQINSRYFKDRPDGLRVAGQLAHLICAWS
jgi:methyltransferase (TIGR00027 family)